MPEPQKIGRRWWNAKAIIDGACNPRAICHSIIDGCNEVLNVENGDPKKDEAVRIMTYQLSYILGVQGGAGYVDSEGKELFGEDYHKVKKMAEAYDQQEEKARFNQTENEKIVAEGLKLVRAFELQKKITELEQQQADEAAKRG